MPAGAKGRLYIICTGPECDATRQRARNKKEEPITLQSMTKRHALATQKA
jgi:hypothetical protein